MKQAEDDFYNNIWESDEINYINMIEEDLNEGEDEYLECSERMFETDLTELNFN